MAVDFLEVLAFPMFCPELISICLPVACSARRKRSEIHLLVS